MQQNKLPKTIGIIMDGNRRVAQREGLPSIEGHRRGTNAIVPIVERAITHNIQTLIFWAFSTENWRRNPQEVHDLLTVFREALTKSDVIDRLLSQGAQLQVIGDITKFPQDIVSKLMEIQERSKKNTTIRVYIALNYGGREEIVTAVNIALEKKEIINDVNLTKYLYVPQDIDLVIRTGGQQRLSGFMLWQTEYSELYFTDTLWPEFTPVHFDLALEEFDKRKRNFGK